MTERSEIDPEMLMAFADGELSPLDAKRVERAIAENPALAQQVEDHRRLRAVLAESFAAVIERPVPEHLTAMVRTTPVVDLAQARADRAMRAPTVSPTLWQRGGISVAAAASLVVGVILGQHLDNGAVRTRNGALVASAGLADALDTQLASAQGGKSTRILATFRSPQGDICRSFSGATFSGIACREGENWQLRTTRSGAVRSDAQYQQAGSGDAALMADAQAMMAGDPFDAAAEQRAKAHGWQAGPASKN
jgi:hypothetical protein